MQIYREDIIFTYQKAFQNRSGGNGEASDPSKPTGGGLWEALLYFFGRMIMLDKESAYYENNLSTLQEKYMGRYIVISGDQVIGAYDSDEQAYIGAMEAKCIPGAFMIKPITKNPEDQVQRFSSLVYV